MKKIMGVLGALALATLAALAVASGPAAAVEKPYLVGACTDWYVNPDETDRKPEPVAGGLKFEATDLVHHAANLPLADLKPGTYAANRAPDQPSFFSVEVRSPSGAYATLRWNPVGAKWTVVIGAGTGPDGAATAGAHEGADPVALLAGKVTKWGAFDPAKTTVVSFGVGFTKSPPGAVAVVVSSVTFQGKKYSLKCVPAPGSSSASASASASAAPSASASVGATAGLPVTGSRTTAVVTAGGAIVLLGAVLTWLARRKRARFEA